MKKILFIIGICAHSLYSQEIKKDKIQNNTDEVLLNEVIISANKFSEKQDDLSQKTDVIKNSQLQKFNQSSTADVLANSGNVLVQKSQLGGGSPIIRGFEANKVLMVVDGVRMNNAIYRGGHLQNVITLDNSALDRIEILFGPGSVIYGSDALGGVLHFMTKNPVLSNNNHLLVKGNFTSRYFSAANGYLGHVDVSIANQKFGSITSVTYSDFDDLRQGNVRRKEFPDFGKRLWTVERINNVDTKITNYQYNIQKQSGYSQYDILQKFVYEPSKTITHTLNLQFSNSSDIPRYDRLTELKDANPKFSEWYYGPQRRLFSAYEIYFKKSNSFFNQAKIITAYQNIEESRNSRKFNNNNLESQIEELDIFSVNADFEKKINQHEIRYGADCNFNLVNSTATSTDITTHTISNFNTRYPDGGSNTFNIAIYGSDAYEFNEQWILNGGIRATFNSLKATFTDKTFFPFPFDDITQQNGALNGKIGMIYKTNNSTKIYTNFGTGFRTPNVDDLAKVFDSNNNILIVPNPNLKPEYTYNGEIGFSKTFMNKINLSSNIYYTHYENILLLQPSTFNGQSTLLYNGNTSNIYTTQNANKGFVYGFETIVKGKINKHFATFNSFNYTFGRVYNNHIQTPLDHIPPVFGKLGLTYQSHKITNDFFVNYNGWKALKDYSNSGEDNLPNATAKGMPSWYTLNNQLNIQFNKTYHLQVACENILDHNYRVFASNISAPGRNLIVTFKINY